MNFRNFLITILCIIQWYIVEAQSSYVNLSDYSGITLSNTNEFAKYADSIKAKLPESVRANFKVVTYNSYIQTEAMHGSQDPATTEATEKLAAQGISNYILIITYNTNQKLNAWSTVDVNFPTFGCVDQEYINMMSTLIEKKVQTESVSLGIISGLIAANQSLGYKIKCQDSTSIEEIKLSLESQGYYLLPCAVAMSESNSSGVVTQLNLSYQDHSTNMVLEASNFPSKRLREVNPQNAKTFKIQKPSGTGWYDVVLINANGEKLVYLNMAIDVSEGLHASAVAPAIVYALKFIYEVGSEMLFDVAIQLVMEKFTTGVSWGTAWNNLEVDQASVKSAFVSGSLSFVASFFGAAKSNTGQVAIAGLSEAVSYLLGFSGGAQGGMTTRSSGFSLTTFCEKFIQGASSALAGNCIGKINQYKGKLASSLSKPNAKDIVNNIENLPGGSKILTSFEDSSPTIKNC